METPRVTREPSPPSSRAHLAVVAVLIGAAALSRLVPHPPNFAPVAAIALFGGAHLAGPGRRLAAYLVPLAAMLLSDLVIGPHRLMPVVYAVFLVMVAVGRRLGERAPVAAVAAATLGGSMLLFVATNLGVWLFQALYPKTMGGLAACFVAALPFFGNTVLGDALSSLALFGGFRIAARVVPGVRAPVR